MKTHALNEGNFIPVLGLETWKSREGDVYRAVGEGLPALSELRHSDVLVDWLGLLCCHLEETLLLSTGALPRNQTPEPSGHIKHCGRKALRRLEPSKDDRDKFRDLLELAYCAHAKLSPLITRGTNSIAAGSKSHRLTDLERP